MRETLLAAAITALLSGSLAPTASASGSTDSFTGVCTFNANDEFAQPPFTLRTTSGTLRGTGRCTGRFIDSNRHEHRLEGAAVHIVTSRSGVGGCAITAAAGVGRLTFPDGELNFTLTEEFVGPVSTEQLTGESGGSASTLIELVDRRPIDLIRNCVNDHPQEINLLLQLISPGISG
jgi:hypothetical protein